MRQSENPSLIDQAGEYLLEITVQSPEAAQAAERGGADRIELCAELSVGGLTPNAELRERVRTAVKIPVFSMIRPRAGDFVYSPEEYAVMAGEIERARASGMDGVVLGILRPERAIDVQRSKELVERARPMKVTFHRALDGVDDIERGIEDVVATGADRVLTSGGSKNVVEGAAKLRTLLHLAAGRVIVMPGSGIRPENFQRVRESIGAREYHCGLGSVFAYGEGALKDFEEAVRAMSGASAKQRRDEARS